jgi:hypothetical protein
VTGTRLGSPDTGSSDDRTIEPSVLDIGSQSVGPTRTGIEAEASDVAGHPWYR